MAKSVLFVCMGNICRSPSAEGIFSKLLKNSKLAGDISVDSAGTHGYHVSHPPDHRAIETAVKFGVDISALRARKVSASDFNQFDLIIAMDRSNYADLQSIQPPNSRADLKLMMSYHPDGKPEDVPDPYYGGMNGFTHMDELLESATAALLRDLEQGLD